MFTSELGDVDGVALGIELMEGTDVGDVESVGPPEGI